MVKMRIVFIGTSDFAVPSLNSLLAAGCEVCAVFTQPDKPAGRGQKLQMSPVKRCALEYCLRVFQPEKIRSEENRAIFETLGPDFIVVAAYGQILPAWLLGSARIAPVNVHGSLLPRYRGAAPVTWAILNGESITGVTTMLMDQNLDTGAILLKREVPLNQIITGGELSEKLALVGAELLLPTLEGLRDHTIVPLPQNACEASWAPKITKDIARISWNKTAWEIHNLVRGLNPSPVATTEHKGQNLRIFRTLPVTASTAESAPGKFLGLTECGMHIQCGQGTVLEVIEVQMPGKQRISGRAFAAGIRIKPNQSLFSLP
ncbi:MAG: methionyl-tRNA formyltransferase [Acidobacteria bacterium]|nr:methionyl-tRNA formyltransferase [Acidobacteriota bacterium]